MTTPIRRLEESDISAAATLRAQRLGTEEFWAERIAKYLSGEHDPQRALAERAAFVASDEVGVVGFVAGHRTQRFDCEGELQWIDVAERVRRRGVGYQLMAAIGGWFVEHDALRVCVNVESSNVAARKLYASCGAQDFKEGWMIWEDARTMIQTGRY